MNVSARAVAVVAAFRNFDHRVVPQDFAPIFVMKLVISVVIGVPIITVVGAGRTVPLGYSSGGFGLSTLVTPPWVGRKRFLA